MTSLTTSLARGRSVSHLSPATVIHVLRLVHNGFTPDQLICPGPSIAGPSRRRIHTPARRQEIQNRSFVRSSHRSASSAHALRQEGEDGDHGQSSRLAEDAENRLDYQAEVDDLPFSNEAGPSTSATSTGIQTPTPTPPLTPTPRQFPSSRLRRSLPPHLAPGSANGLDSVGSSALNRWTEPAHDAEEIRDEDIEDEEQPEFIGAQWATEKYEVRKQLQKEKEEGKHKRNKRPPTPRSVNRAVKTKAHDLLTLRKEVMPIFDFTSSGKVVQGSTRRQNRQGKLGWSVPPAQQGDGETGITPEDRPKKPRVDFLGRPVTVEDDGPGGDIIPLGASDLIGLRYEGKIPEFLDRWKMDKYTYQDPITMRDVFSSLEDLSRLDNMPFHCDGLDGRQPHWLEVDCRIQNLISSASTPSQLLSPAQIQFEIDSGSYPSTLFASTEILSTLIFAFQASAQPSDWIWLAKKISDMLTELQVGQKGDLETSLPALAFASLAFCLARASYGNIKPKWNSEYKQYAVEALDLSRRAGTTASGKAGNDALHGVRSLQGLVAAHLGEYEMAKELTVKALNGHLGSNTRIAHPRADTHRLLEYREILHTAGRLSDLADIALSGQCPPLELLLWAENDENPVMPLLSQIFCSAIASMDQTSLEALDLDDHLSTRQTSILFTAFSRYQMKTTEALHLFQHISSADLPIPIDASQRLCMSLIRTHKHDDVLPVYVYTRQSNETVSREYLTSMHVAFTQIRKFDIAMHIFDEIASQYKPTFWERITVPTKLASMGRVDDTRNALRQIFGDNWKTDPEAISILLRANTVAGRSGDVGSTMEKLLRVKNDVNSYNQIIGTHVNSGRLVDAIDLFNKMLDSDIAPTTETFSHLIRLFGSRNDLTNVGLMLEVMERYRVQPDAEICAAVLRAHINAGDWTGAAKCWNALPFEFRDAPSVSLAIMKAFVTLGVPPPAVMSIFRKIASPTSPQWALAILSYCDAGQMKAAANLFAKMDDRAKAIPKSPHPDVYTFSILLYGYLRQDRNDMAKATLREMGRRLIVPSSVTYASVISAFLSAQDLRHSVLQQIHHFAMAVYRASSTMKGLVVAPSQTKQTAAADFFGPFITSASRMTDERLAMSYYNLATMESGPGIDSLSRLMDVHRRFGRVDDLVKTWRKVMKLAVELRGKASLVTHPPNEDGSKSDKVQVNITAPSNLVCSPLSIALGTLSAHGRHADVKRIWNEVRTAGFGFDASNFNALTVALARTGDLEGAFYVIDRVLIPRWEQVKARREATLRTLQEAKLHLGTGMNRSPEEAAKAKQLIGTLQEKRLTDPSYPLQTLQEIASENPPIQPESIPALFETVQKPNRTAKNRTSDLRSVTQPKELLKMIQGSENPDIASFLLQMFRPEDTRWKPSVRAWDAVSLAYGQIQVQQARLWREVNDEDPAEHVPAESEEMSEWDELLSGESNDVPRTVDDLQEEQVKKGQDPRKPHIVRLPNSNNSPVRDRDGTAMLTTPLEIMWRLNQIYPRVVKGIFEHRGRLAERRSKRNPTVPAKPGPEEISQTSRAEIDQVMEQQKARDERHLKYRRDKLEKGKGRFSYLDLRELEDRLEAARKELYNTLVARMRPPKRYISKELFGYKRTLFDKSRVLEKSKARESKSGDEPRKRVLMAERRWARDMQNEKVRSIDNNLKTRLLKAPKDMKEAATADHLVQRRGRIIQRRRTEQEAKDLREAMRLSGLKRAEKRKARKEAKLMASGMIEGQIGETDQVKKSEGESA